MRSKGRAGVAAQHQDGHPLVPTHVSETGINEVSDLSPQPEDSEVGEVGVADDSWEALAHLLGAESHRGPPQDCREEDPGAGLLWT